MRRTSCGRTGVGDPAIVRFVVVAGARVSQTTTGKSGPAAARGRLPQGLIGVSAHAPEEAGAQLRAGADYMTLSPIFLSPSKPGYGPAVGLDALQLRR